MFYTNLISTNLTLRNQKWKFKKKKETKPNPQIKKGEKHKKNKKIFFLPFSYL